MASGLSSLAGLGGAEALAPRPFAALLAAAGRAVSGGAKEGDASAVDALLAGELPALDGPGRRAVAAAAAALVGELQRRALSAAELRAEVEASGVDLPAPLKEAIVAYWTSQADAVRSDAVARSSWTPTIRSSAYRIDVLTSSRTSRDLNQPTAILELKSGERPSGVSDGTGHADVVRFEMDRDQLRNLLSKVEAAEACIAEAAEG